MNIFRLLAALAVAVVTFSASATEDVPNSDEALANALRSNPTFVRALVEALKRDPALLEALVREAKSDQSAGKSPAATAPTAVTAAAATSTQPERSGTAKDSMAYSAIRGLLDLPVREGNAPDLLAGAMLGAGPSSPASGNHPRVQLDAATGASVATISWAKPVTSVRANGKVKQETWTIKASAPIDRQDQGRAMFASTSGLPSGVTIGGDYTLVRLNDPTREDSDANLDLACDAVGIDRASVDCSAQKVKPRVEAHGARARQAWDTYLSRAVGWTQVLNAHTNVSHTQYKYFDAVPTAKVMDSKIGWSVGGLAGLITPDYLTFVGAGFDFAHSYKEANDSAECLVGTTPYLACTVGKFAAPTNQIHRIVSLQARRLLAVSETWQVPMGFTAAHDLATTKGRHENSVDMPFYLLRDKDGWFDGGLRLGWSTTDHFIAGIFVGSRFSLQPPSSN